MFSTNQRSAGPWVRAIFAAAIAGAIYMLIAREVDPFNPHWPAALVIGCTLGVHIYRRSRWRVSAAANKSAPTVK